MSGVVQSLASADLPGHRSCKKRIFGDRRLLYNKSSLAKFQQNAACRWGMSCCRLLASYPHRDGKSSVDRIMQLLPNHQKSKTAVSCNYCLEGFGDAWHLLADSIANSRSDFYKEAGMSKPLMLVAEAACPICRWEPPITGTNDFAKLTCRGTFFQSRQSLVIYVSKIPEYILLRQFPCICMSEIFSCESVTQLSRPQIYCCFRSFDLWALCLVARTLAPSSDINLPQEVCVTFASRWHSCHLEIPHQNSLFLAWNKFLHC